MAEDIRSVLTKLMSSSPYTLRQQWYNGQDIYLDGFRFERCRFDRCRIILSRGVFEIERCFFAECQFLYLNEAGRIVRLYNFIAPIAQSEARMRFPSLIPTIHQDGTVSITS